jgi:hypothetical protein
MQSSENLTDKHYRVNKSVSICENYLYINLKHTSVNNSQENVALSI